MISSVPLTEHKDHREGSAPNFTYNLGALQSTEPLDSLLLTCTTRI